MTSTIRDLHKGLLDAWNARDAAAYAALIVDDGVVIGFDGSLMVGAAEVEKQLGAIFADHTPARYVARVEDVRQLGAERALLRAKVGMVPPGTDRIKPDNNAWQVVVAERRDGEWRVVLFQNTPAQYHGRPDLVEEHTAAMQKLV